MSNQIPQISLNKLPEFINASQARKNSILKTIKSNESEDASKRIRYASAKSAISSFLVDREHNFSIFEGKNPFLRSISAESDQRKNDITNSLKAIKHLEKLAVGDLNPYLRLEARRSTREQKNVRINGVLVHLSPDIVFYKDGQPVGAMKLVFSKSRKITSLEGQVIAGLIARNLKKLYKCNIAPGGCFAVDVFSDRLHPFPSSFSYHQIVLRKTYREINTLWPKLDIN